MIRARQQFPGPRGGARPHGPAKMKIRRPRVEAQPNEHARARGIGGGRMRVLKRGPRDLQQQSLLRQQFRQLLGRNTVAPDGNRHVLQVVPGKRPVGPTVYGAQLGQGNAAPRIALRRQLFFPAPEHPRLKRLQGWPAPHVSGQAHNRHGRRRGARLGPASGRRRRGLAGPFLDEQMGVDAAKAETVDRRPPGNPRLAAPPRLVFAQNPERTFRQRNLRAGFLKISEGREGLPLERQQRLD